MAVNKNNIGKVNRVWMAGDSTLAPPGVCYLCGATLLRMDVLICAPCNHDLSVNYPACPLCAMPVVTPGTACGECQSPAKNFTGQIFALYRYTFPLDCLIQDLKFRHRIQIAGFLGYRMAQEIIFHKASIPECLVPVPLHKNRVAERGYNQSLEIARVLSVALGLPVRHDLCVRNIDTPAQSTITSDGRGRNVHGAFAINKSPAQLPAHVCIVDDVITTGATVHELARALYRRGVSRIDVWAAARTVFSGKPPRAARKKI